MKAWNISETTSETTDVSVKIKTNGIISLKVKIYICISSSSSIESQDC